MSVTEKESFSYSADVTVTSCGNCPHAKVRDDEKYCLMSNTSYHAHRVTLCVLNANALTADCPAVVAKKRGAADLSKMMAAAALAHRPPEKERLVYALDSVEEDV